MNKQLLCADCGTELPVHKAAGRPRIRCKECSDVRNKAKHAEWSKEYSKTYEGYEQVCKQCGGVFKNQAYRAHCSEACNAAYVEGLKRKATCKKCGIEFRPKNPRYWQYCSRGCAHADIATWYNANKEVTVARYSEVRFKKCVVCGADFTSSSKTQQACQKCAEALAAHNIKRPKRSGKDHIRRAKNNGGQYEHFDPILVFARDGWACKICGIETPLTKRGTNDNNAPELDHVIPLSKGGAHSFENSQCACKQCNRAKSNTLTPPT